MTYFRIRRTLLWCTLACAAWALAACGAKDTDAAVMADLRAQLEGSRVCAMLIAPSWPIEGSAALLSQPGIDALIAAGLVERHPIEDRANVTPRARISLTRLGEQHLLLDRLGPGSPPEAYLCFGRKQVTDMRRDAEGVVHYRYRVVDAPAWAKRSDMREAFPFMARRLDQEQQDDVAAVETSGKWSIPRDVMQHNLAEMGNKGFFPCPFPDASPQEDPCR